MMVQTVLERKMVEVHKRLKDDFDYFADNAPLYIKTKEGTIAKFGMNEAQQHLHKQIEAQKAEKGFVRVLVLKGRQQGVSTYVSGRFYQKTSRFEAKSTFILSHDDKTTTKLFDIVKRFNDLVDPQLKPELGKANKSQLVFSKMESDYWVGTAKTGATGRGGTLQYFHGSEVAFWHNTDDIKSGIMQSVADCEGSESILESTANGTGNMFYQMCMDALAGKGDYILVFIPWFWQTEYARDYPKNFKPTVEEVQYAQTNFKEHTSHEKKRKLFWRRMKVVDLGEKKFKQEYPCCVIEAFQFSGESLFDSEVIMRARKTESLEVNNAARILGVDAARKGDKTRMTLRQGREILGTWAYDEMQEMELVGLIIKLVDKWGIDKAFIDVAYAHGAIDRLRELGYAWLVHGVHFGMRATKPDVYKNKRAEMYGDAKDWLEDAPVRIPDDEELHADLMAVPEFDVDSNGLFSLPPKEVIKKKLGRSPDYADSFVLTFAFPVRSNVQYEIGSLTYRATERSANADTNTTSLRGRIKHGRSIRGNTRRGLTRLKQR